MTLSAGTRLGPYEIVSKLGSGGMPASAVRATCDEAVMSDVPPRDWGDKSAWDSYFDTELHNNRRFSHPEPIVLRFLAFAREKGGRIWFPGCGLDHYPLTYARNGCRVVATDLSSVAVNSGLRLRVRVL